MMATREGVDFSGPYPSAEALRAAGRDFVLRYARKTGDRDKQITAAEAAYWKANRIDVGIVEESLAQRALSGRASGAADATAARSAVRAVGGPADGGVIYMAVDFQPDGSQMAVTLDYLRGAASVLGYGRTGVYGSYKVCQAARDAGIVHYLWQTYAWSAGAVLPGIHLYQYSNSHALGGVDVDYDRTTVDDWGQWPTTEIPEDDMAVTDADALKIANAVAVRLNPLGTEVHSIAGKVGQLLTALSAAGVESAKRDAAVLAVLADRPAADVDEQALAAELAPLLAEHGVSLDVDTLVRALRADLSAALAVDAPVA
jgi:hypothetical protein